MSAIGVHGQTIYLDPVAQMVVVIWALLGLSVLIQFWIAVLAGIMTLWSGIAYAGDAIRQLSASPRSGPIPGQ